MFHPTQLYSCAFWLRLWRWLSLSSGVVKFIKIFIFYIHFSCILFPIHNVSLFWLFFLSWGVRKMISEISLGAKAEIPKYCASGSQGNGSWLVYGYLKAFYFLPFLWVPISAGKIPISFLNHMCCIRSQGPTCYIDIR